MAIVAKWRAGFEGFFKADAQKVAEEIAGIGEAPTPQQIVAVARDGNTELHKCFEWRDDIAAEKYRVIQARKIVCHLVIEEETIPEDRPEIRFFYKTKESGGYRETRKIVKNDDAYADLLKRAYAELRAFKAKYSMLEELHEIFELIH